MARLCDLLKGTSTAGGTAQVCLQAVAASARILGFRFTPFVAEVLPLVMERCRAASAASEEDDMRSAAAEEKDAALMTASAIVTFCSDVWPLGP
jgi:hypothetical protein